MTFDDVALHVLATVVDRPEPDLALIDAGSKVFSSDKYSGNITARAVDRQDVNVTRLSEEHGFVIGHGVSSLRVGDRVLFTPAHVCPVVNLADRVHVVQGGEVVDVWRVDCPGALGLGREEGMFLCSGWLPADGVLGKALPRKKRHPLTAMKIIRYSDNVGAIHYARETGGSYERLAGELFGELTPTGEVADVAKVLAPLVPSIILCIGLNYRHHAEETKAKIPDFPILFIKTPNTLQNPGDPIQLPTALASHQVDYECELAVVIGKTCKNVKRENALEYVFGYTAANDVSARDWQKNWGGGQWCRGKSFDTFAPLGPVLVTSDEIANPNSLGIKTIINGETLQDWNTGT